MIINAEITINPAINIFMPKKILKLVLVELLIDEISKFLMFIILSGITLRLLAKI